METIVIAAVAKNGVIGRTCKACPCVEAFRTHRSTGPDPEQNDWPCQECEGTGAIPCNDIPWSYPEDMRFFRDTTMGHAVVMGRRTWESLPAQHRPLKGRANIVVSHTLYGDPEIELTVGHLDTDALDDLASDLATRGIEKLYVIGGAQLYAAALPHADTLLLTMIDRDHEGDVIFPGTFTTESVHWSMNGGTEVVRGDGYRFVLTDSRLGTTPGLLFTKWVRR